MLSLPVEADENHAANPRNQTRRALQGFSSGTVPAEAISQLELELLISIRNRAQEIQKQVDDEETKRAIITEVVFLAVVFLLLGYRIVSGLVTHYVPNMVLAASLLAFTAVWIAKQSTTERYDGAKFLATTFFIVVAAVLGFSAK